ncbi:flagella basal body P-ring formation protein FlgA [Roseovarius lutimaris]|uniref:Flagella basal body P-ring formation protein FlgA n=1 Tax=Roseovarius lutimaris TaxID=1005928 RepID=A0A1I5ETN7_9RHOB|nr:flagellar basal body P-ring formation chaperone FlgA [Roseovarius lutimaris]SFO14888.1 flagella basal body P-ring formation protein FlgA [Roseovarius lutimaris]
MRILTIIAVALMPLPGLADTIVAARTIRAKEIIEAGDLLLKPDAGASDVTLHDLIGQEAQVSLYVGRPVRASDVGAPAVVERNQVVPLIYAANGLQIVTEGRSLSRAGVGEYVRVMNLTSRATVSGRVTRDGQILVSQ